MCILREDNSLSNLIMQNKRQMQLILYAACRCNTPVCEFTMIRIQTTIQNILHEFSLPFQEREKKYYQ